MAEQQTHNLLVPGSSPGQPISVEQDRHCGVTFETMERS